MFEMTHENSKNVHLELFARHYFNEHFNQYVSAKNPILPPLICKLGTPIQTAG